MSFLFDENPDVASVGSVGAAVGGAKCCGSRRSLELRASGSVANVGNRFSAVRLSGIDRLDELESAAGRGSAGPDG
jgi:hypothetical protein